jgi:hypothetical protein
MFDFLRPLNRKVRRIERAIRDSVEPTATESIWVTHYGAFDIDPVHLVYWVCVRSDAERDRLAADQELRVRLRSLLTDHGYPAAARDRMHIGFESQETVDRDADGDWWHHWK